MVWSLRQATLTASRLVSPRRAGAFSLAILLLSPPLAAQQAEPEPSEDNGLGDTDSYREPTPEEINEMEVLEDLEQQMLEDLEVRWSDSFTALDLPGDSTDPAESPRATTFYRVPGFQGGFHHQGGTDEQHDSRSRLTPGDSIPTRLGARFDLSGIEPIFGLDHLQYDQIQAYLHFYTTRGRRHLAHGLALSGRYRGMILQALSEAGLPRELLYLVLIESGFNPVARSHAGAVGLWQFMPATARSEGLTVARRYDQRRDPEASTRAAIRHLEGLYDRFGNWTLAMAAYNAGSGHVSGQIRRYNMNDFWRMDDYGAIWDGTRRYVYRIIAAAIIGEHPERFGFEGIALEGPERYDVVQVPGNTRLSVFSRALDIDVDTLMELNPALLASRTPDVPVFDLHIPSGATARFIESYDRLDPSDIASGSLHRLRFGETVEHVAAVYGVEARVIRYANGLDRRRSIPYGSEILVPLNEASAREALTQLPPGGAVVGSDLPVAITPAFQFDYRDRPRVFYEVQAGDEVLDVAEAFGVSIYDLGLWNDVDPEARLFPGMILQVFPPPGADLGEVRYLDESQVRTLALGSSEYQAWDEQPQHQGRSQRRRYTVRRGDSINSIAQRFGVRASDIIRWNELADPDQIRAGQVLRVQ